MFCIFPDPSQHTYDHKDVKLCDNEHEIPIYVDKLYSKGYKNILITNTTKRCVIEVQKVKKLMYVYGPNGEVGIE